MHSTSSSSSASGKSEFILHASDHRDSDRSCGEKRIGENEPFHRVFGDRSTLEMIRSRQKLVLLTSDDKPALAWVSTVSDLRKTFPRLASLIASKDCNQGGDVDGLIDGREARLKARSNGAPQGEPHDSEERTTILEWFRLSSECPRIVYMRQGRFYLLDSLIDLAIHGHVSKSIPKHLLRSTAERWPFGELVCSTGLKLPCICPECQCYVVADARCTSQRSFAGKRRPLVSESGDDDDGNRKTVWKIQPVETKKGLLLLSDDVVAHSTSDRSDPTILRRTNRLLKHLGEGEGCIGEHEFLLAPEEDVYRVVRVDVDDDAATPKGESFSSGMLPTHTELMMCPPLTIPSTSDSQGEIQVPAKRRSRRKKRHKECGVATAELQRYEKTRMCAQFRLGSCDRGSQCRFAHGVDELRATSDVYKTKLCSFHSKGYCRAGDMCRHAHGESELRTKDAAVQSPALSPGSGSSTSSSVGPRSIPSTGMRVDDLDADKITADALESSIMTAEELKETTNASLPCAFKEPNENENEAQFQVHDGAKHKQSNINPLQGITRWPEPALHEKSRVVHSKPAQQLLWMQLATKTNKTSEAQEWPKG